MASLAARLFRFRRRRILALVELLQQVHGLVRPHAAQHFARRAERLPHVQHRRTAETVVLAAEYHRRDAHLNQGGRAHDARLHRHHDGGGREHSAPVERPLATELQHLVDANQFRVPRGILRLIDEIRAGADDLAVVDEHTADGHFAVLFGQAGDAQRRLHELGHGAAGGNGLTVKRGSHMVSRTVCCVSDVFVYKTYNICF